MERYNRGLRIRRGTPPPGLFSRFSRKRIYALIRLLFGLCCWSAAVWVVWNLALSGFLNAGWIGPLQSLASGTILYALSLLFHDTEPRWHGKIPERPFRIR